MLTLSPPPASRVAARAFDALGRPELSAPRAWFSRLLAIVACLLTLAIAVEASARPAPAPELPAAETPCGPR